MHIYFLIKFLTDTDIFTRLNTDSINEKNWIKKNEV